MSYEQLEVLFGGGGLGNPGVGSEFENVAGVNKAFTILNDHGVTTIDTARGYINSEAVLGETKVANQGFTIDTKWAPSLFPGQPPLTKAKIIADAKDSIQKLGVKQVGVFYLHCPEPAVGLEEQLDGINEVYQMRLFQRFGLSNFSAQQVEEVYNLADRKGFVKPTVYQGLYAPVNRTIETTLFPTLRKLGIAFRAYSPLAGGFLAKTRKDIEAGEGRFGSAMLGPLYKELYHKPEYLNALDEWGRAAQNEGVSRIELALRWMKYHSSLTATHGDGIIVGAGTTARLDETLKIWRKGPLSAEAVKSVERVWTIVEPVSHENNIVAFQKVFGKQ